MTSSKNSATTYSETSCKPKTHESGKKEELKYQEEDKLLVALKTLDEKSRANRAVWLHDIGVVEISSCNLFEPSSRIEIHAREAEETLINGCCISSIFNSSTAVQEAFKHIMIRESPDRSKTLQKLRGKRYTFGLIIDEARNLRSLKRFVSDARWLNSIRNGLSAHPLYVDVGRARTPGDLEWEATTTAEELENMLSFLPTASRKYVYSSKIGKRTFGKAIASRRRHDVEFLWYYFRARVLPVLAQLALLRMLQILPPLGFHFQSKYRFWWELSSERRRRAFAKPSSAPGADIRIVSAET